MKKATLKKLIALLLALALLCALFSGCGNNDSPAPVDVDSAPEGEAESVPESLPSITVCLDVSKRTMRDPTDFVFQRILKTIEENGGPAGVEVEYMPQEDGVERETALTRLRTEIMAGEGPDLFINSGSFWGNVNVFPFPEKSMYNGLFLPLDEYIENAQFAHWEDFNQTAMEAGRTEKGQMIVPLSYTFPITCFRKSEASHTPSQDITWDDMLVDDSLTMKAAAVLQGGGENVLSAIGNPNFDAILGRLADYENEELLFSEEDFTRCAQQQMELFEEESWRDLAQLPEYFQTYAGMSFFTKGAGQMKLHPIKAGEELTMIPHYNKDGGVTATVYHYACINANTKHPEEAFYVLDYLLCRDRNGDLEDFYSLFTNTNGLPIDRGVTLTSFAYDNMAISDENQASLDAILDCITAVNVYGKLNNMLAEMISQCYEIQAGFTEGDPEALIAETYRVMKMELAES